VGGYGSFLDNPLLFPTFHDTITIMFDKVKDGTIPLRAWAPLKVLFMGYGASILLAAIFTILAISTRLQERVEHAAHGRPQLRPARIALRRADPDPRGVRIDPDRIEDRLGVRMEDADRRRTGVRRVVGAGWPRMAHLREPNLLDIPAVFAGLLTVIVIGLIVENLIFRTIERNTVQKWGSQS
jgi:hypothetical protein